MSMTEKERNQLAAFSAPRVAPRVAAPLADRIVGMNASALMTERDRLIKAADDLDAERAALTARIADLETRAAGARVGATLCARALIAQADKVDAEIKAREDAAARLRALRAELTAEMAPRLSVVG